MNSTYSFVSLLDSLPDPIARFDTDLKLVYANRAFTRSGEADPSMFYGKTSPGTGLLSSDVSEPWLKKLETVIATGRPAEHSAWVVEEGSPDKYVTTKIVPEFDADGRVKSLLAIGRELSDLQKLAEKLKERNELLEGVLNTSPSGIVVMKSVRNEDNEIIDFRQTLVNNTAKTLAGRDVQGSLMSETFPETKTVFDLYRQVVETGREIDIEHHNQSERVGGWFRIRAARLGDGLVASFEDITAQKRVENEIKESRFFSEQLVNMSPDAIFVLDLVSKELTYLNHKALDLLGNDFNYIKNAGVKMFRDKLHPDDYVRAMRHIENCRYMNSTELREIEVRFMDSSGSHRWFNIREKEFRRGPDGLVQKTIGIMRDVHVAKLAKETLEKQERLLQDSERISRMGSWERNTVTGELIWSDGLYRVYGLEPRSVVPVTDFWLQLIVHPKDKNKAAAHLDKLYNQLIPEPEEYRIIRPDGAIRTVTSEPEIIFDKDNRPFIMRGVITDVTETRKLEKETEQLRRSRQREMLGAALNIQEEERRRIAEALHNDLGQMLYITKLKVGAGNKEAEELLNMSINRVKTISFELMPSILQDYGLDVALKDLMEKRAQGTSLTYINAQPQKRLQADLEIAVFRIVQELLSNIIKHSNASRASVKIEYHTGIIRIKVKDNGQGFDPNDLKGGKGSGLRNIKNRLEILSGEMNIISKRNKGSLFSIYIPEGEE